MTSSLIDLSTDDPLPTIWDEHTWIGAGKTYPSSNTPAFILAERSKVIQIPSAYISNIPNKQLSIIDLLKYPLLSQASVLILQKGSSSYSNEMPNENLECLLTRPIPPKAWLQALEAALGQAWFDGKRSIIDPRFKQSRLPLWVLSYWKEMSEVLEQRARWKKAEEWLRRWGESGDLLEEADRVREMLASLDWGSAVSALGATCPKHNLTHLLSDDWIDDEIMNMTMHDLAARVHLDPDLSKTTIVANLALQNDIHKAFESKDYSKKNVGLLYRYTELFKSGKRKHLYFPTHVDGNHWVPMLIDFEVKTIRYGNLTITYLVILKLKTFNRGFAKSYHKIKTHEAIERNTRLATDYVWNQVQRRRGHNEAWKAGGLLVLRYLPTEHNCS